MQIVLYIGATLTALWGISHLVPTKNVVAGFGNISDDNRWIITMEWIVEGVSMIFIGVLVGVVTFVDAGSPVAEAVYIVSAINLVALALVSLFTGFKVHFFPFKLCPFILTASAVLVISGAFLG